DPLAGADAARFVLQRGAGLLQLVRRHPGRHLAGAGGGAQQAGEQGDEAAPSMRRHAASPRRARNRASIVSAPASNGSGAPAATAKCARRRRGTRIRPSRESRLLHLLPPMLRRASGTPATCSPRAAARSRIFSTPDLNGAMAPSFVNAPSGK